MIGEVNFIVHIHSSYCNQYHHVGSMDLWFIAVVVVIAAFVYCWYSCSLPASRPFCLLVTYTLRCIKLLKFTTIPFYDHLFMINDIIILMRCASNESNRNKLYRNAAAYIYIYCCIDCAERENKRERDREHGTHDDRER